MNGKTHYNNGQAIFELKDEILTYYFKNGKLKARGSYVQDQMQGEWVFYRETGQLWQIGNFKNNQKHGSFVRYNRNDEVEYNETFNEGKQLKSRK